MTHYPEGYHLRTKVSSINFRAGEELLSQFYVHEEERGDGANNVTLKLLDSERDLSYVYLQQNERAKAEGKKCHAKTRSVSVFFFYVFENCWWRLAGGSARERKMPARGKSEVQVKIKEDKRDCVRPCERLRAHMR